MIYGYSGRESLGLVASKVHIDFRRDRRNNYNLEWFLVRGQQIDELYGN